MPFAPAIPFGGLAGFRFVERTFDKQFEVFNKSPDIEREVANFRDAAQNLTSIDQLMADRRVLSVILGAFGLDDDIDKRAFIRKVIEEGTLSEDAFANRLVEPAYREMSEALGFGDFGGMLVFENTRENIVSRFRERQFELAVGDVDLDMRLALNFKREAANIVEKASNDNIAWLGLLGSPPLRQVVEGALNLPSGFASIDLDKQVEELSKRAESTLGISSPKELLDGEIMDDAIERFLLTQQVRNGVTSSSTNGAIALTLLQSSGLGSLGQSNLFASNF